jgi:hypothetical protein
MLKLLDAPRVDAAWAISDRVVRLPLTPRAS